MAELELWLRSNSEGELELVGLKFDSGLSK